MTMILPQKSIAFQSYWGVMYYNVIDSNSKWLLIYFIIWWLSWCILHNLDLKENARFPVKISSSVKTACIIVRISQNNILTFRYLSQPFRIYIYNYEPFLKIAIQMLFISNFNLIINIFSKQVADSIYLLKCLCAVSDVQNVCKIFYSIIQILELLLEYVCILQLCLYCF